MREWWERRLDAVDRAMVRLGLAIGALGDVLVDMADARLQERRMRRRQRAARAEIAARDPHADAEGWRP